MDISGANVLVTGANRGIGKELTRALVEAGAAKVYAGARDVSSITDPDLIPVKLDVTDEAQVQAAAAELNDVSIVINNAGIGEPVPLLSEGVIEAAQREMDVNYFGLLSVTRAFAPILKANGGGAVANVLSVASWLAMPSIPTYAASKSAAWSLTHSLRIVLREQGTLVVGFHFGFVDTDLTAGLDIEKLDPTFVAAQMLAGIQSGSEEVFVDDLSKTVKANLPDDLTNLYPGVEATYQASVAAAAS